MLPPTLNERLVQKGEGKGSTQTVHKVNGSVLITILLLVFLFGSLGLCSLHIHSFSSHKGFVGGFFVVQKFDSKKRANLSLTGYKGKKEKRAVFPIFRDFCEVRMQGGYNFVEIEIQRFSVDKCR